MSYAVQFNPRRSLSNTTLVTKALVIFFFAKRRFRYSLTQLLKEAILPFSQRSCIKETTLEGNLPPKTASSLPIATWQTEKPALHSVVLSQQAITKAHCSLEACTPSTMQVQTPTFQTTHTKWGPCTGAYLKGAQRPPAVHTSLCLHKLAPSVSALEN